MWLEKSSLYKYKDGVMFCISILLVYLGFRIVVF